MSKYRNLAELNKLSDEMFAEFGFHSLTDEEKEQVLQYYIEKHLRVKHEKT
jgi:uncharacterized Rossmann fold enzyme